MIHIIGRLSAKTFETKESRNGNMYTVGHLTMTVGGTNIYVRTNWNNSDLIYGQLAEFPEGGSLHLSGSLGYSEYNGRVFGDLNVSDIFFGTNAQGSPLDAEMGVFTTQAILDDVTQYVGTNGPTNNWDAHLRPLIRDKAGTPVSVAMQMRIPAELVANAQQQIGKLVTVTGNIIGGVSKSSGKSFNMYSVQRILATMPIPPSLSDFNFNASESAEAAADPMAFMGDLAGALGDLNN